MIQGNFYKKLHFYMDSCAISPMASLFVEYTEKKTSVFQIQLEFWVNITLCFWLMYPTPGKVGFCLSYNSSNLFPLKWLRMTRNGQFRPIHNFSNIFPPKWLRMTQNGQFSPIHNFSNLSPLKWLRMTWNGQFCLIRNFSNLFPPKWLRMTQNGQFHLIYNFSNLFPPKWHRMTRNSQFCMAKIKYTLIQWNFCERLPFYMDSCALSPTASLLT